MDDIIVLKTPYDMDYGVHLAYMGKELIAKAFALGRSLDKPGYIDKLDYGRGYLFGVIYFGQLIQPFIRNGNYADIGVYRTEGIIGRLRVKIGQGVEKGAFAHIGQADDTEFHKYTCSEGPMNRDIPPFIIIVPGALTCVSDLPGFLRYYIRNPACPQYFSFLSPDCAPFP